MPAFRVERRSLEYEDLRVELLDVVGEVDATTAMEFHHAVVEAIAQGEADIILSFKRCHFADTTIVRPMAAAVRELRASGRRFAAVVCNEHAVRRVLDFSGLQPQVALFVTHDEAIAALRETAGQRL